MEVRFFVFFYAFLAFEGVAALFFFIVLIHRVQTRRFFPPIHFDWRLTYCRRSTFMLE